jgi:hypothetical protein
VGVGVLGFGVGGLAPTPKPPIPNPQSPIPISTIFLILKKIIKKINLKSKINQKN